ncbi:hypothetical protein J437_LFUL019088 [Ladona fulva]|uniref:DDE-1 domain-containing protein n=1 Tax=Ladona fulva TaxID=123851 RepID=A0A8K0KPR8_LADFU|nr:hypothetical protein J437_LFUL019088 [Ladona fulva]
MDSLYKDILEHQCKVGVDLWNLKFALLHISPSEFAYLTKRKPGYTAVMLGEVTYLAKCTPVEPLNSEMVYPDTGVGWVYKSSGDLVSAGIYSDEDLEKYRKFLTNANACEATQTATLPERGRIITAIGFMSAAGVFILPALIFPRKRMNPLLYKDAPIGTFPLISDTGYMNSDSFIDWLKHFVKHAKPSPEDAVLLIADNHASHYSF